ncbi:MAG TPA: RNA-binding S4 domain-containing protein [Clostridiaceae bacterium]|jgi:ribosome-associated protein|nr:RNA-binding S4 domain-containing protein [Clostridiaceae bacterium]
MENVKINTEYIKLDQFIKWAGIVITGSQAKQIIIDGRVKVNDQVITLRGKKLRKGDIIEIDGKEYKIG